jgi:hypothetical protein
MPSHTIIKLRRGTAAEWEVANEILKLGEPGFEKDTFKLKIGDGITAWNDLPYITGGFGGDNGPLEYVYDEDMGSDDNITPIQLYFDSRSNYIDYSNFYNYIIDNNNIVSLKLTSKNNPNNFFIASSEAPVKQINTGSISAFWPSASIQWIIDGGDDQYDSANFINNNITTPVIPTSSPSSTTLRTTSIPYNSGRVSFNSQYWGTNDYVTLYKKNIFAMVAKGNALTMPSTVYYAGNAGADGDGDKDVGSLSNYNGYQAGYCRLWGDDPTYTKLIISKVGSVPTYTTDPDNDTNDDLFVASELNSDTIAMVVFYAADMSNPSSLSDIQLLFESFVDNVLVTSSDVEQIYINFNTNIDNVYSSVDPSFWYDNFEFFTGTNEGDPNLINAEGGSGSNLQLSVTVNQDTRQYDISINNSGSNYQNGDIVVLRGDNLSSPDGRSPDEDIYIEITGVDTGGEVLSFNTILNFTYNFTIDKILSRADGFRFNYGETYYLNIDIIGGGHISNPLNNRVLTSDGTVNGINAESNLTFDGYRLSIDCTCPSGLAGLTIVGDQRSNLISSAVYSDPQEIVTEDGTITTRQISRLIFTGARGTRVAPSGLQDGDVIFNIRGDAYNPFGTLNSLGNIENRTIRIRGLVTDTGTHYSPSTLNIETSSGGPSGLYDNSMTFDHNGILKVNNMPINIVVIDNGNVSGSVATDASSGQIFDMIVTGSTTLSNPINAINGTTIRWRIQQDGTGGHSVSLGDQFVIPSSASSPLPWSTTAGAMDVLAATYHAGREKWDIVAFVPGY